jgi:hypothetical protein
VTVTSGGSLLESVQLKLEGKDFDDLEEAEEKPALKPLVFISCGQSSPEEVNLGRQLATQVTALTSLEGYFAEGQNSLAGLTSHVFRAIERCAYFVGVMHYRGEVNSPGAELIHLRASVWIEQEIAIAAFLTSVRDREIPVLLYVQKGIKREGMREQLKLAPIEFTSDSEVLADFIDRLSNPDFKKLANDLGRMSSKSSDLRARGEELYSLMDKWSKMFGSFYLRRNSVMQGKLSYNQCLDLDLAEGKSEYDFSRIELLVDVDFPKLRPLYDKIYSQRGIINEIWMAFRRSCDIREHKEEQLLTVYVEAQIAFEHFVESFQKQLRGIMRGSQE